MTLNKIHNADCLEFMKGMPDKCVDLVLTDPPYGIKMDKGTDGFGVTRGKKYSDNWDNDKPDITYFREILRIARHSIIFGGNYFTELLPQNNHWIVWDKVGEMKFENPFSDCELAWTDFEKKTVKKYIVIQQGFVAEEKERFHPTQKPVKLFSLIINDYTSSDQIIFDPFVGSGTTAIACLKTGRKFIGCEISKKYCDIANKRIDNSLAQQDLFREL